MIGPCPKRRPNPGSKGGKASALAATPEERSDRAQKGGQKVLERYGVGYFSALARAPKKTSRKPDEEA